MPFLMGKTPPSKLCTGVCVPVAPPAGVPIPLNGLAVPLGGTGMLKPSGLAGTIFSGRPSIWMRFAELL